MGNHRLKKIGVIISFIGLIIVPIVLFLFNQNEDGIPVAEKSTLISISGYVTYSDGSSLVETGILGIEDNSDIKSKIDSDGGFILKKIPIDFNSQSSLTFWYQNDTIIVYRTINIHEDQVQNANLFLGHITLPIKQGEENQPSYSENQNNEGTLQKKKREDDINITGEEVINVSGNQSEGNMEINIDMNSRQKRDYSDTTNL